jgi:hypothetical protein
VVSSKRDRRTSETASAPESSSSSGEPEKAKGADPTARTALPSIQEAGSGPGSGELTYIPDFHGFPEDEALEKEVKQIKSDIAGVIEAIRKGDEL